MKRGNIAAHRAACRPASHAPQGEFSTAWGQRQTHRLESIMSKKETVLETCDQIEHQIDGILETCARLQEENRSLLVRQEALITERAALVTKNEQARSKVEAMIARLRTMEQHA